MNKRDDGIKLSESFFNRKEIKVIESLENGQDYLIFYMKLLLKGVVTNGELRFRDTIPYTYKMLSAITDTNIDTVRAAIEKFIELEIMEEWEDGTLFMTKFSEEVL